MPTFGLANFQEIKECICQSNQKGMGIQASLTKEGYPNSRRKKQHCKN